MRRFAPLMLVLALAACDPPSGEDPTADASQELTRRQKDSLVSTMPIPGSRAVGKALRASDAARERAEALEALGN